MHSVMGDIIVISGLAIRVQIAYKDAPHGFRHISDEVEALQVLINRVKQYWKNTTIISDNRQEGQKVLKGCQSVLEDLNSLFEKYKRRAFTNKQYPFLGVKLGKENIISLQERLIFNTGLLHGFLRSCEHLDIQVQLAIVLGLRYARIPVTSIATFAAHTNTRLACEQFCEGLKQVGVTERMIHLEKDEILDVLKSGIIRDQDHNSTSTKVESSIRSTPKQDRLLPRFSIGAVSLASGAFSRDNPDLLHLIAGNSHAGTVELLFEKGAFIDKDNNTLLHCAAGGGFNETVKLLLEKGAPVEAVNNEKNTPLHLAAEGNHAGVVEVLLQKGASIGTGNHLDKTPLHLAAQHGRAGVVEVLLGKGASVEAVTKSGNTPLHLAAHHGRAGVVEVLLGKGASVEAMNSSGNTSLHLAAQRGHAGVAGVLLGKGASVEAVTKSGNTPLQAAAQNHHTDVVKLLDSKQK